MAERPGAAELPSLALAPRFRFPPPRVGHLRFRSRSDARFRLRHAAMELRRLALLGIETVFGVVAVLGRGLHIFQDQGAADRHLQGVIMLAVGNAIITDA